MAIFARGVRMLSTLRPLITFNSILERGGPAAHRYPVGPTFTLPAPCQAWEQPATPQTLQPELLVLETAHRSHSQAVLLPHR